MALNRKKSKAIQREISELKEMGISESRIYELIEDYAKYIDKGELDEVLDITQRTLELTEQEIGGNFSIDDIPDYSGSDESINKIKNRVGGSLEQLPITVSAMIKKLIVALSKSDIRFTQEQIATVINIIGSIANTDGFNCTRRYVAKIQDEYNLTPKDKLLKNLKAQK